MYLNHIKLENDGPIRKLDFELPYLKVGDYRRFLPLPVIAVGASGSGKSIFISRIIDALTELAKYAFDDIVPIREAYFRLINPNQITSGEKYLVAEMEFSSDQQDIRFLELVGDPSVSSDSAAFSAFGPVAELTGTKRLRHTNGGTIDKIRLKEDFKGSVIAYFPSNRSENPHWLNLPGVTREPSFNQRRDFVNVLQKPFFVETAAEKTKSWILDCAVDSMVYGLMQPRDLELANTILRIILRDPGVFIKFGHQASGARVGIQTQKPQRVLPDIEHLSSAESILFNMFSTIVRYGTKYSGISSSPQDTIEGIVLIDEVDAHLHSELQYEVLPKLIRLFPRVQFILTSHSPLFLMGMEKEFGEDGIRILELPEGRVISSERFSEFAVSLKLYSDTKAFEDQIISRLQKGNKPLVCTEGKTDAIYIKTAIDLLGFSRLKNEIEVDPIGKEGSSSVLETVRKLRLNNSSLFPRTIVLLYDNDQKMEDKDYPNFFIRGVKDNPNNTIHRNGIENLLPEEVLEERFYEPEHIDKGNGTIIDKKILNKMKLCRWVCEERKQLKDFENFRPMLDMLQNLLTTN